MGGFYYLPHFTFHFYYLPQRVSLTDDGQRANYKGSEEWVYYELTSPHKNKQVMSKKRTNMEPINLELSAGLENT